MIDLRLLFLLAAILLYGALGSPTPDSPGWVEGAIGLLLIAAVGPGRMMRLFSLESMRGWRGAAMILLLYGVSVPFIVAIVQGNGMHLVVRDVVPFLFLLMPLFLVDLDDRAALPVRAAVAAVGVLFALRLVGPFAHVDVDDPLYLSIAPTVIFAALLLFGLAGAALYRRCSALSLVRAALFAGLGALPVMAMVLTMQRASLGLFSVGIGFLLLAALVNRPVRALVPLAFAVAGVVLLWPVLGDVAGALWHKHGLVGLNMRAQEAEAVFEALGPSPLAALFGNGWGATFESPAVGGERVNFTHNLMSAFLLKTGAVGMGLVILYIGVLVAPLVRLVRTAPVMAVALGVPVAIDCFLYASFKSFDFGLILLLVMLWTRPGAQARAVA